jgi:hypothetical protein
MPSSGDRRNGRNVEFAGYAKEVASARRREKIFSKKLS